MGDRLLRRLGAFGADKRGIAATEFAFIVPLMLVMFFGTVEFCSGIAVDRKVTLMARTLSDLTSQSTSVGDSDMSNFFAASTGIMYPYSTTPVNATITELYVDPKTMQATVMWSKGSAPRSSGTTVGVPADLLVSGTYLIFSEVNYQYVPTIGYVMAKTGIKLSDVAYTRPRQSTCVFYSPKTSCQSMIRKGGNRLSADIMLKQSAQPAAASSQADLRNLINIEHEKGRSTRPSFFDLQLCQLGRAGRN